MNPTMASEPLVWDEKEPSDKNTGAKELPGTAVIVVESGGLEAGNHVRISINDHQLPLPEKTRNDGRGLHIVVIDPSTMSVVQYEIFDTSRSSKKMHDYIRADNQLSKI